MAHRNDEDELAETAPTRAESERSARARSDDSTETVETPAEIDPTLVSPPPGTGVTEEMSLETVATDDGLGSEVPTPAPTPTRAPSGPKAKASETVIAGRFEVVRILGEGGMGRVYHVRDRQISEREVALKVLRPKFSNHPHFRELFFKEIKAAQRFVSEHVNQVRDTGITENGELFLTMDLVQGEDLRALLKRENSLHVRHALEVARQTLLALASGHEQGFVHRDVKPENIMLAQRITKTSDNPYGVGVRLLDFGIAGLAADIGGGQLAGTPMYMSPEQAQGQRLDARSDLFAVGVVLYEMVAGSRPFHGKTVDNIITSVLNTDVNPLIDKLDHLSKPVRKVLRRALEKEREKRYGSAAEFIKAIERSPAFKMPTAVPGWASAAIVVGLAGAGGTGYMWNGERGQTEHWRQQHASIFAQLSNEREAKQTDLRARDEEITKLNARIAELRAAGVQESSDEGDQFLDLKKTVELLRESGAQASRDIVKLTQDISSLNADKREYERQVADLTLKLAEYKKLEDPVAVSASNVDTILSWLENGEAVEARTGFQLMRENPVIVNGGGFKGAELIVAMTGAHAALEEHDAAEDGAVKRKKLEEARQLLSRARKRQTELKPETAEWVSFKSAAVEPDPRRLERIDAALTAAEKHVQDAESGLLDVHDGERAALLALGPMQDPSAPDGLFAHAAKHAECTCVGEIGVQLARWLERETVADGALVVDELLLCDVLGAWQAQPALLRRWLDPADLQTLDAFWQAKLFYDADPSNDAAIDVARLGAIRVARDDPHHDWRAELALKIRLGARGSNFPIKPGRSLLYWRSGGPQTLWEELRLDPSVREPVPGATQTWSMLRQVYGAAGNQLTPQAHEYVISCYADDRASYREKLTELVKLKAWGPQHKVGVFEPRFTGSIPANTLFAQPDEVAGFFAQKSAQERLCLVVEQGETTLWISPEYGVMREKTSSFTRELIFHRF